MQTRLREIVQHVLPQLERMEDAVTSRKPSPDTWSPKEILGHLVDSAQHNHGRFVQIGLENGVEFPGDDQNAWVKFQRWQDRPWVEIVCLWESYNLHLAWVIEGIPESSLGHQWIIFRSRKTVTLHWLVQHYLEHLEHHVQQIRERTHP
jgi:hypothetical protein